MKYKVILFDADETLFDFRMSEKLALKGALSDFGIKYDENYHLKIYMELNTAIWKEFEEGRITQEKLKIERFRRFANELKIEINEFDMAKSYMKHLSNASFLFDGAEELVKKLSKDYKLGIITNGLTDVQDTRIRKSVIAEYFETIVISEEAKIAKPDARIYDLTLRNMNHTDKKTVLYVGDSLSSDIQGGINAGIDTCWVNKEKTENLSNIQPTYIIQDLSEIINYL